MKDKKIIGLTGGIASGKSTVAKFIKDMGIVVIDADQVARDVVEPGTPAWKEIIDHFGPKILSKDGKIDRAALGSIVFTDPESRKILNRITHPQIRKEIARRTEEALKLHDLVVLEIPLLIESKNAYSVDEIWVVYADADTQLARLISRNGLTEEEGKRRIESQMPLDRKVELADHVIDNNGSEQELKAQVEKLIAQLQAKEVGAGEGNRQGRDTWCKKPKTD